MKRTIFIISDGTGLTVQALGHSLLTQFPNIAFDYVILPYTDSREKINQAIQQINQIFIEEKNRPIVFTTLIKSDLQKSLSESPGIIIDFFSPFISILEKEFQLPSDPKIGQTHGLVNYETYKTRIDAVNYALNCDDGLGQNYYDQADLILLGVSRSGKTPTCLYLAIEFGVFPANYPLTEELFSQKNLPAILNRYRHKLFGLMIDDVRLHQIRSERKKGSKYASLLACQQELTEARVFFKQENISYIDTTSRSIEEIATSIMAVSGIKRRGF